jgi:hypothetical protein
VDDRSDGAQQIHLNASEYDDSIHESWYICVAAGALARRAGGGAGPHTGAQGRPSRPYVQCEMTACLRRNCGANISICAAASALTSYAMSGTTTAPDDVLGRLFARKPESGASGMDV